MPYIHGIHNKEKEKSIKFKLAIPTIEKMLTQTKILNREKKSVEERSAFFKSRGDKLIRRAS